jgi:hypothetical protein
MTKAVIQTTVMTARACCEVLTLRNVMGCRIAKYLSSAITVSVTILAETATPATMGWKCLFMARNGLAIPVPDRLRGSKASALGCHCYRRDRICRCSGSCGRIEPHVVSMATQAATSAMQWALTDSVCKNAISEAFYPSGTNMWICGMMNHLS